MKELAKASEDETSKSSDKKTVSQVQEVLFFEEIKSLSITCLLYNECKLLGLGHTFYFQDNLNTFFVLITVKMSNGYHCF